MALNGFQDDSFFDFPRHSPAFFHHRPHFPPFPDFFDHPKGLYNGNYGLEKVHDTEDGFEVEIAADGFQPDEIEVSLKEDEKLLTISAHHEAKQDKGNSVAKQFKRSFLLPENCLLDQLKSTFTKEGKLKVTAPKEVKKIQCEPTSKQIQMEKRHYRPCLDRVRDGENQFQVDIDMDGFKPEDLNVDLDSRTGLVTVSAKHEDKASGGFVARHFRRQYQLPESCNLDQLQSTFSKEGVLMIEAPKRVEKEGQKAIKSINIKVQ